MQNSARYQEYSTLIMYVICHCHHMQQCPCSLYYSRNSLVPFLTSFKLAFKILFSSWPLYIWIAILCLPFPSSLFLSTKALPDPHNQYYSVLEKTTVFTCRFEGRKWKISDSWVYDVKGKILVAWSTYKQTSTLWWHGYNWLQNTSLHLPKLGKQFEWPTYIQCHGNLPGKVI